MIEAFIIGFLVGCITVWKWNSIVALVKSFVKRRKKNEWVTFPE